ncbi:DMT family transporter [Ectobacillus panaciterrae]|uniref:DMT family transporter n=1 Tax=Ectobacillus panaciterrae TaxID=363872 RepID=UPI000420759B|nr:EamA family transporter [Ectobacillus panaciterrae]
MSGLSKKATILGIAFVILSWSLTWPISKIGLHYSPPLLFAGMRTLLGGILLAIFLSNRIRELQWKKNWRIFVVSALFNVIIFIASSNFALKYLPSGLYTVILYSQPVLVVLLSWLWLKESMTVRKLTGILLGFFGVLIVSFKGLNGYVSLVGILLALISALGWTFGTVYVKKNNEKVHWLWLVAMQNLIGGIFMTCSGLLTEDAYSIEWKPPLILSLFYGGVIALGVATAVYNKLMSVGESSKVASFTFLVPVLAVGIGSIFLGEDFTISIFGGLVLIFASIYLINSKKHRNKNE